MTESFNNMTNSHALSVSDALGVLVSAAEARRDQYQDLADHKGVEAATEELWDVGAQEADNMAELIGSALEVFREHRDKILDAKREAPSRRKLEIESILRDVINIAERIEEGLGQAETVEALRNMASLNQQIFVKGFTDPKAQALDIDRLTQSLDDIGKPRPGRVIIGVDPAHPDSDKSVMMRIKDNKPVPFPVNPEICHHPADSRQVMGSPHYGEWCDDCGAIL